MTLQISVCYSRFITFLIFINIDDIFDVANAVDDIFLLDDVAASFLSAVAAEGEISFSFGILEAIFVSVLF